MAFDIALISSDKKSLFLSPEEVANAVRPCSKKIRVAKCLMTGGLNECLGYGLNFSTELATKQC